MLDVVKVVLGVVAVDVGEVEGEGSRFRGVVGLGDGDVLCGEGDIIGRCYGGDLGILVYFCSIIFWWESVSIFF